MSIRKESVPVLASFKTPDGQVVNIDSLLKSDYEDIGEAAARIPPNIGFLGYHKAKAYERLINNKHRLKEAEARAYFELKNGAFISRGYGEKMTEAALEHAVNIDTSVIAASEAYAKEEKNYEWLSATIEALESKLELLRSVEATKRMEHEHETGTTTI